MPTVIICTRGHHHEVWAYLCWLTHTAGSLTADVQIQNKRTGASTGSTDGLFQGVALQESFSATEDFSSSLEYSQHTQNQRHELHTTKPIKIRFLRRYVKKRAQRSEDSILLRDMDDVVGTGPEEQLMSDFEHVKKTSLYLTDVVVLRHEGDTVNFLGLEITKTSEGFEVKNSTDLVESLLNLYGLENSKSVANTSRRFNSDGARVSNSSEGS